mmetsp:Transcript_34767/g.56315  ORF Transcript_34767/g.56315 Transcript_34767/m.56315 type:complete len:100 (+) Transcript_34767:382-681(+)
MPLGNLNWANDISVSTGILRIMCRSALTCTHTYRLFHFNFLVLPTKTLFGVEELLPTKSPHKANNLLPPSNHVKYMATTNTGQTPCTKQPETTVCVSAT